MMIAIGISIIIVLGLTYAGMRKYVIPSLTQTYVEDQVKEAVAVKDSRIKELNHRLSVLGKQLHESQTKYTTLSALIKQKVKDLETIKKPETKDETVKRYTDLGYPPKP